MVTTWSARVEVDPNPNPNPDPNNPDQVRLKPLDSAEAAHLEITSDMHSTRLRSGVQPNPNPNPSGDEVCRVRVSHL